MTEKKSTAVKKNVKKDEKVEAVESVTADALEHDLELEDHLAGVPELKAPARLRRRDRNKVVAILNALSRRGVLGDASTLSNEDRIDAFMDMAADIDEFAESIALDHDAYVEWSVENADNIEAFMAIFEKYSSSVGE